MFEVGALDTQSRRQASRGERERERGGGFGASEHAGADAGALGLRRQCRMQRTRRMASTVSSIGRRNRLGDGLQVCEVARLRGQGRRSGTGTGMGMGSDSWPWMVGLSKSEPLPTRNRQSSAVEADKPSGSFCSPPNPPRARRHRQPCNRPPVRRVSLQAAVFPSTVLPAATTTTAATTRLRLLLLPTIAHTNANIPNRSRARPPRLRTQTAARARLGCRTAAVLKHMPMAGWAGRRWSSEEKTTPSAPYSTAPPWTARAHSLRAALDAPSALSRI